MKPLEGLRSSSTSIAAWLPIAQPLLVTPPSPKSRLASTTNACCGSMWLTSRSRQREQPWLPPAAARSSETQVDCEVMERGRCSRTRQRCPSTAKTVPSQMPSPPARHSPSALMTQRFAPTPRDAVLPMMPSSRARPSACVCLAASAA